MKTTILIKENRTQLVLHPESEHDKAVLDVLEKMPNTHRRSLYDRQGGFTMFDPIRSDTYGNRKEIGEDLMIVFDRSEAEGLRNAEEPTGEHSAPAQASPPPADSQGDKHD